MRRECVCLLAPLTMSRATAQTGKESQQSRRVKLAQGYHYGRYRGLLCVRLVYYTLQVRGTTTAATRTCCVSDWCTIPCRSEVPLQQLQGLVVCQTGVPCRSEVPLQQLQGLVCQTGVLYPAGQRYHYSSYRGLCVRLVYYTLQVRGTTTAATGACCVSDWCTIPCRSEVPLQQLQGLVVRQTGVPCRSEVPLLVVCQQLQGLVVRQTGVPCRSEFAQVIGVMGRKCASEPGSFWLGYNYCGGSICCRGGGRGWRGAFRYYPRPPGSKTQGFVR